MMKIEKRLAELIEQGAAVQIPEPNYGTFILAAAEIRDNPPRLRWCAIYPEHQSHVHEMEYDEVAFSVGTRDIDFRKGGKTVMYVCPYEESGLSLDGTATILAQWRGQLATFNNEEQFKEFFDEA